MTAYCSCDSHGVTDLTKWSELTERLNHQKLKSLKTQKAWESEVFFFKLFL
jgi:hypothetical protein